jgi:multimeric flavodoxin WrbA
VDLETPKRCLKMKILALIGSPRKGSNTDTLVDQILRGAEENGNTCEKLYLYDFEISPCIDCRNCKKGDFVCTLKDGMQNIYPKIEEAELIIFGTPIYWYGPTGVMKLLIDRLRPFIANGKLKGKKAILVTPSEEGPAACGPLVEMFNMSFKYLGMEFVDKILVTAYEKGEVKGKEGELDKAYKRGVSL